ncbi:hypothetical protein D3C73_423620 [compost metagenome]
MAEANILKCRLPIQVLHSFFKVNIIFVLISGTDIMHVFLYVEVNPTNRIDQGNETLEVGIDVILYRDS